MTDALASRRRAWQKDGVPTLRRWLADGPFALGMSSGFFGFFAHCGVLSVLEEEGLTPARVAGSSAGALVTGSWAAGLSAERLAEELLELERADFWDPRPGPGLLAGRLFRRRLERLLPVDDLAHTRVPAAVSVYDVLRRRVRVLDRGPIAPALHASCAVPLMFHPVRHAGGLLVDGGVADRPGLTGLRDAERILFHHLASRSPWRGRDSEALRIPRRPGLVTLVVDPLPRVGPFRMPEGARAFEAARRGAREALNRPIRDDEVRVTARRA
ncbi:MAG TPA: patatin-like phospholipase family protein [Sandaracinaceae bacterium LLY-WYZ-13_1]|nr:patatin-like phospholipase family protein [Sandaracinaceae bacterium LLY-WYZ-13_1]